MPMRPIFGLVLCLTSVGIAGPLDLGTFSVSGSGTFECDPTDSVAAFGASFSGSNANYAITAGAFELAKLDPDVFHKTKVKIAPPKEEPDPADEEK